MQRLFRRVVLAMASATLLVAASPATADHDTTARTKNLHPIGHSEHRAAFLSVPSAQRNVSSDIAFWGHLAIHGNYDGFRIVDISDPEAPQLISHPRCNGDQGDVVVWENIVVRSWNSPAPAGRFCDGLPVAPGFEGLHVFDISNLSDPDLVATVPLPCGSHTATGVPDLARERLIVYSNVSSGCTKNGVAQGNAIDIVEVPLGAPQDARVIGSEPIIGGSLASNNGCHDFGVILGDVNMAACASGHAANVFSIGAPLGGSLEDPLFMYTVEEIDGSGNRVGVGGRWHSAAFSWDGEVLVLGWEPGGGSAPECEATDPAIKKSAFFYDAQTGAKLGQWVLPRAQSSTENCTVHNYNIVPLRSGDYVMVSGNYQAGTWVTDFTNPANPQTIAYADPEPLVPSDLGGAWSTYWYNNFIYESDITKGLNIFRLSDRTTAGAMRLPHLNPQTQEFSLP